MDPFTAILLLMGFGSMLKNLAKWLNWQIGSDPGRKLLDEMYEEQKDRLQHEYAAAGKRIKETAATIYGQQQATLAAMGQWGGEGTVSAGILQNTELRKKSDLSLLRTSFEDALEDLQSQYELALQEQSEELAFDLESSIAEMVKLGAGSMSLGMEGSRELMLNDSQWIKPESGAYTWGLLG